MACSLSTVPCTLVTSPMRIAVFTESYEPIVNGVSVFVATLRDELERRGHQVFIFAPRFQGHIDEHPRVFRWPARHTPLMRDYPFPKLMAPAIWPEFESLDLDVVHTQTPFVLGAAGGRWARRLGIPFVSTNHTLYTEYLHYAPIRPKALTKLFLVKLMKWYYSGCDAVVVPSEPVKKILRGYGVSNRIEIIKTGVVAAAPVSPEERRRIRMEHGADDDGALLLYVGRIAREKNLDMLLRAFASVRAAAPQTRLLLVGGGPALGEVKAQAASLGLQDSVQFVGMLRRSEIDPLYAAADLFVFPSTTETQGIAICEALSAGLPVVAVNAGGIPENIQSGVDGFLTPDDPTEFAERIQGLIEDPGRRLEMSANARANSANFCIERMVGDFERLYSSVIDANKAASTG